MTAPMRGPELDAGVARHRELLTAGRAGRIATEHGRLEARVRAARRAFAAYPDDPRREAALGKATAALERFEERHPND